MHFSLFITLKQTFKECTGKRFTSQVKKRPVAYLHIQPNIRPFLKSDFRQDIRLLYLVHRPDTGYKKCRIVLNFKTHPPNRPDSLRWCWLRHWDWPCEHSADRPPAGGQSPWTACLSSSPRITFNLDSGICNLHILQAFYFFVNIPISL